MKPKVFATANDAVTLLRQLPIPAHVIIEIVACEGGVCVYFKLGKA